MFWKHFKMTVAHLEQQWLISHSAVISYLLCTSYWVNASLILTPSNTTLFWSVFPYLIGKNSEIMILTVKCIQLEQLYWSKLEKIRPRPGSNLSFQLLKLKTFKNCKPLMVTFVTSGSSHMILFSYVSIFNKNSPWHLELFPHQKYKCLKGFEQKSIVLLTEGTV